MTNKQARHEAQRRWGRNAEIHPKDELRTEYAVGYQQFGGFRTRSYFVPAGYGDTWEAAFEDADKKRED